MISLILPIVFFCILVLLYPAVSLALSLSAWFLKQWGAKRKIGSETGVAVIVAVIDKKPTS